MEENTVKDRLLKFLKSQRISQVEFTKNLGVSPTYVGAMRKGIPAEKMKKIGELYPNLNREWLLYGDGEMLRESAIKPESNSIKEFETLLLPTEAFAGDLQMWSNGIRSRECQKFMSPISGIDFAIPVKGDSMEPHFHTGSTLLVKRINELAFIPWGNPMVIDTENGVLIKKVMPAKEGESDKYIIAESYNPNYPPFKIPKASIFGLYKVMGAVDIFSNM